ncbi:asparaginase [Actinomycetospora endophytica]|uniref:Asparaginase n=1 Tax=Actinomycetospora endophytica TaxID=2291215 RepID=A0ABS8P5T0_9PSEU|nr:asparaginase [Actinomycetospora endophytica]MCD2193615.1 asparaginase [Actinomycetospora endophytica]
MITTGGTAASRARPGGGVGVAVAGAALLAEVRAPQGWRVEVIEAMSVNSYALSLADLDRLHETVRAVLARPEVGGVVVVHGTDTLEETAMLVALSHDDPRPVVFTGAQRPHDHPEADGPGNLQDAVTAAAAPGLRGRGVVVCFAGRLDHAIGGRKVHTSALEAFADPDHAPLGFVDGDNVQVRGRPGSCRERSVLPAAPIAGLRVGVIPVYPGADRSGLDAEIAAGARGLVLEATGCGNANPDIVAAVAEARAAGIAVLVSTRVPAGATRAVYDRGGGADLVRAGAVMAGDLRPGQARILLLVLLAHQAELNDVAVQTFTAAA